MTHHYTRWLRSFAVMTGLLLWFAMWAGTWTAAWAAPAAEPTQADGTHAVKLTFGELGAGQMELRGSQPIAAVHFGTRMDEVITGAKLRLRMTYSPSMLPELSHLRVSLNGQVLT